MTMIAACRREKQVRIFKRGVEPDDVINSVTVTMLYVLAIIISVFVICGIDGGTPYQSDYGEWSTVVAGEQVPNVIVVSKLILILLMFFGRVGGYTLILVFSETRRPPAITRLPEHIMIG